MGIIVRVPLASGLLSGKYDLNTTFNKDDHRFFNRTGARFDRGETFSGIPYEVGLEAVSELKESLGTRNLIHTSLQWILDFPEVSTIIPGASRVEQVYDNLRAFEAPTLLEEEKQHINEIYQTRIKSLVHQLW